MNNPANPEPKKDRLKEIHEQMKNPVVRLFPEWLDNLEDEEERILNGD